MSLPDDPEAAARELARVYGDHWTIWGSDLHRWWATTTDSVLPLEIEGCRATVDADDLHDLEALLYEQETLRGRRPDFAAD